MKIVILPTLLFIANNAVAQPATDDIPSKQEPIVVEEIVVTDFRNRHRSPYARILKGLEAFEKNRHLAPTAPLRYKLSASKKDATIDGMTVTLQDGSDAAGIVVKVDTDGTFSVPIIQNPADDLEVVLNRQLADASWRPHIRTQTSADAPWRMGDQRLECAVFWAMIKDDVSFLIRSTLALAGGLCDSSKIPFSNRVPRLLAKVTISDGERSETLRIDAKRNSFAVPLPDKSWSNDAQITLTYVP